MERATIQALMTVPSTLVSEGIVSVLTGGLSAKAGKQVVDDITSAIRKDAPHLTYGGKAGIDEYVKSQGNFTNVINAGIKGMKADGDELAKSFLSDLKQTGIQITKKTSTLVERMLKQYNDTVVTMLDDIGNDKLRNSSMTKINEITGEIKDLIVESLGPPGTVAAPYIAKLEQTMMKYGAAQQKFKALAEVFSVLKQSNTAGGLNPQRLQEVIADRVKGSTTYQSALSKDVMSAASRGAPHGSVDYSGIDVNKVADMLPGIAGAPIKAASRVTGFNKIPVGATYHVGTIKGVPNKAAFDAMTQDEIRKFLFRTSKEKE
jgi:protein-tyrosine-phosphatase